MSTAIVHLCNVHLVDNSSKQKQLYPRSFLGDRLKRCDQLFARRTQSHQNLQKGNSSFCVVAVTKGSAEPSKSEENLPSWAKPDTDEPPPWAQEEGKDVASQQFEVPFIIYLLASAVTAIAAIGSIFEYVNKRPVFGVLNSDSIFYAPLLGFFAFTGIPTSAFLWYKSVQVANKEAEEQDKRDGYL